MNGDVNALRTPHRTNSQMHPTRRTRRHKRRVRTHADLGANSYLLASPGLRFVDASASATSPHLHARRLLAWHGGTASSHFLQRSARVPRRLFQECRRHRGQDRPLEARPDELTCRTPQFVSEVQKDPLTVMKQLPGAPKQCSYTLARAADASLNAQDRIRVRDDSIEMLQDMDKYMVSWMICVPKDLLQDKADPDCEVERVGWIEMSDRGGAIHQNCRLGMTLHKQHQGKGYGTEAVRHAVRYAFVSCAKRRIELGCFAWNEPVIKAYKKCGLLVEGQRRRAFTFKEGSTTRFSWPSCAETGSSLKTSISK